MISGAVHDTTIDNLIAELVPAIQFLIRPEFLATGDVGLQALLDLAATEIVCTELLAQLERQQGAFDRVRIGDLEITPKRPPAEFVGLARLQPFLKDDPAERVTSSVRTAAGKAEGVRS
jgi:hypothetical protein